MISYKDRTCPIYIIYIRPATKYQLFSQLQPSFNDPKVTLANLVLRVQKSTTCPGPQGTLPFPS
jgi:hypothetical protein